MCFPTVRSVRSRRVFLLQSMRNRAPARPVLPGVVTNESMQSARSVVLRGASDLECDVPRPSGRDGGGALHGTFQRIPEAAARLASPEHGLGGLAVGLVFPDSLRGALVRSQAAADPAASRLGAHRRIPHPHRLPRQGTARFHGRSRVPPGPGRVLVPAPGTGREIRARAGRYPARRARPRDQRARPLRRGHPPGRSARRGRRSSIRRRSP